MIPLERIKGEEYISVFGGFVPVYGALVMAKINKHLGRPESCRDYAKMGLKVIGSAQALQPELELLAGEK